MGRAGERPWTHWATSVDLVRLALPAHDAGTGLVGASLGESQYGSSFVLDVFDAYGAGLVTNPNVVVAGSIGAGKSTVVKMQLERALQRGRRAVVIDPKGEYAVLAALPRRAARRPRRDGWCDPFSSDDREGRALLRALVASAQGSPLSEDQHFALDEAWRQLDSPRPARVLWRSFNTVRAHLRLPSSDARRRSRSSCTDSSTAIWRVSSMAEDDPFVFDGDLGGPRSLGAVVVELVAGRRSRARSPRPSRWSANRGSWATS